MSVILSCTWIGIPARNRRHFLTGASIEEGEELSMNHYLLVLAAACLVVGCAPEPRRSIAPKTAARPDAPSRALRAEHLMRGLVSVHYDSLKAQLGGTPLDDAGWDSVAMSASLLHEASYLLMRDPPENDGAWELATSQMLRKGAEDLLGAVETADAPAARDAFSEMRRACSSCHRDCPADEL